MAFAPRSRFTWQLRTRSFTLGRRTTMMGILNVTPDSFSDGGRFLGVPTALNHALKLLDEGADLIDIGGESTRPNATPITSEEEQARILPVLDAILRARPDAILSVDTFHAATARSALSAGAEIINDVSGLLWDPAMAAILAYEKPGVVLMHARGDPSTWDTLPPLPVQEVLPLVLSGLAHSLDLAHAAGIPASNIVIDPGFGFGKRGGENFALLRYLFELHQLALPLLVGTSRKRFLTGHPSQTPEEVRIHATTASNVAAVLSGAHILRVHDVAAAKVAATVADSILATSK